MQSRNLQTYPRDIIYRYPPCLSQDCSAVQGWSWIWRNSVTSHETGRAYPCRSAEAQSNLGSVWVVSEMLPLSSPLPSAAHRVPELSLKSCEGQDFGVQYLQMFCSKGVKASSVRQCPQATRSHRQQRSSLLQAEELTDLFPGVPHGRVFFKFILLQWSHLCIKAHLGCVSWVSRVVCVSPCWYRPCPAPSAGLVPLPPLCSCPCSHTAKCSPKALQARGDTSRY